MMVTVWWVWNGRQKLTRSIKAMVCAFTSPVNHHSRAFEKVCCHLGSSMLEPLAAWCLRNFSHLPHEEKHLPSLKACNLTVEAFSRKLSISRWYMYNFHPHRPAIPSLNFIQPVASTIQFIVKWCQVADASTKVPLSSKKTRLYFPKREELLFLPNQATYFLLGKPVELNLPFDKKPAAYAVCMYIYIYIHIRTFAYIHIYIYIYIHLDQQESVIIRKLHKNPFQKWKFRSFRKLTKRTLF